METQVTEIPLGELNPSPGNRSVGGHSWKKLQQLAESIQSVGVQQPIVVRRHGDGYEIVAGERRWRACEQAGLKAAPCIVRELTDSQALRIQVIENVQREEVHPLDEADGYSRLLESGEYSAAGVAGEVGKSIAYVYQRLRLLELVEPARTMLSEGKINVGHANLIARMPESQQHELVEYIDEALHRQWHGLLTVSELRNYIDREMLHDLNAAPFDKEDAELAPDAGACVSCPKRSGAAGELFAEIAESKHDYCTDPECFSNKLDALVERWRDEPGEDEEKPVQVNGRLSMNVENDLPKPWDYREVSEDEEEAQRALIATGPDRGRLTYVKFHRPSGSEVPSEEEKERRRQEREAQKERRALRERLFDEALSAYESSALVFDDPPNLTGLPDSVVYFMLTHFADRSDNDSARVLCKRHGWEDRKKNSDQSYIVEGWRERLLRGIEEEGNRETNVCMLMEIVLVHGLHDNNWSPTSGLDIFTYARHALGMYPDHELDRLLEEERARKAEEQRKWSGWQPQGDLDEDEGRAQ